MAFFVLGIDGGGSHTEACLFDAGAGRSVFAQAGPSNMHGVGLEAACQAIAEAARAAAAKASQEWRLPAPPRAAAMACCLSGAGRPAERQEIASRLGALDLADRIAIEHDAAAILAAGRIYGPGIAVIAGTGSFVWGRNAAGATARADGWGSLLGDEGGGFQIGLHGLRAVCRAHDRRGPDTALSAMALEQYSLRTMDELIAVAARPEIPRELIAGFAPRVIEAAAALDPVALGIVDEAISALAQSCLAVRERLFAVEERVAWVLGGGLASRLPFFRERVSLAIVSACSGDETICPSDSPALGAARMALAMLGIAPGERGAGRLDRPAGKDQAAGRAGRDVFDECKTLPTEQINPATAEIDLASPLEIARLMNAEDSLVAGAVEKELPQIAEAIERIVRTLRNGGRLFYIGAGTSGRIGCLDASEIPPTFGAPPWMVQGIVAGGAAALLRSREGAEDRAEDAPRDLALRGFCSGDFLVGLAASRRTPYVLAALRHARSLGAQTTLITCSPPDGEIDSVDVLIAPLVGPEAIMGSTRLKSATAQKMICNMLTTASMIRLGKVYRNMMVDLQLSCGKLEERAKRVIMLATGAPYEEAAELLAQAGGSVKRALAMRALRCASREADAALERAGGFVRAAIEAPRDPS